MPLHEVEILPRRRLLAALGAVRSTFVRRTFEIILLVHLDVRWNQIVHDSDANIFIVTLSERDALSEQIGWNQIEQNAHSSGASPVRNDCGIDR